MDLPQMMRKIRLVRPNSEALETIWETSPIAPLDRYPLEMEVVMKLIVSL